MLQRKLMTLILVLISGMFAIAPLTKADNSRSYFDQNLPGRWELRPNYVVEKDYALNPNEAAKCRAKMQQLLDMLQQAGPLAAPKGFIAEAGTTFDTPSDWYGQAQPPYKTQRVRMGLNLRLPGLFNVNGKLAPQVEPPTLKVYFNNIMPLARDWSLNYEGVWDEQGRLFFVQPIATALHQGEPIYGGRSIVLTKGSKALWVPVTQEQYLNALFKFYRDKKKRTPSDSSCDMAIQYFTQELGRLSSSERKNPAYYNSGSDNPSGLVARDSPDAQAMVALNPAYFDPAQPRTALQLIIIKFGYAADYPHDQMNFREDGTNVTLFELQKNLNYAQIATLLDRAGK